MQTLLTEVTNGLTNAPQLAASLASAVQRRTVPANADAALTPLLDAALSRGYHDPGYERVAARLVLRALYRQTLGSETPSSAAYRHAFRRYVEEAVDCGALDRRLLEFDLDLAARAIEATRDELLPYIGVTTLADRYLVRQPETRALLETPQFLFMRVALGLALAEPPTERPAWALRFYEQISTLRYLPSTPTLFNAGTPHHQLSACYLADVHDSMDHILESVADYGRLAKYAGGIGASISKLRAAGAPVRGINGESSGIVPFAHLFDALIKGISQGGRRRGTMALYLEPWHIEIDAFLDLRKNSGDPYLRTPSLNTALWAPDEFFRRVERDADWYLFDPHDTPELTELTGRDFRTAYEARILEAESGRFAGRFQLRRACELYRAILASLQETSHPWIVFKDAGNLRSMLPGTIHSSNLCTEIFLPTTVDEVAVCNLASINLARHLTPTGVAWNRLAETVQVAVRGLDNVIDINFYPIEKARTANRSQRPVGLGLMGVAEVFARLGMTYGDPASLDLIEQITEFISFHAISASCDLAEERGAFPAFTESRWAAGKLPHETGERLARHREQESGVVPTPTLDWEVLRKRTRAGIRNGTLMAIAPTATISLIAGTTPSLDPYYANVFARQTLSGKFMECNPVLIEELQVRGLWEQVRERIIEERGDLSAIDQLPEDIRGRFPTAYGIAPEAYVAVAARAQQWVDMGISRNLYLHERSLDAMEEIYLDAWRAGLKSTYYLFMAPRMFAEQSSVKVNKAKRRPNWNLELEQPEDEPAACSLESGCESCQ